MHGGRRVACRARSRTGRTAAGRRKQLRTVSSVVLSRRDYSEVSLPSMASEVDTAFELSLVGALGLDHQHQFFGHSRWRFPRRSG